MTKYKDSSYFVGRAIKNNKPIPNTNVKYCIYCQSSMHEDFHFEDKDKIDNYYCTCEKAEIEISIKDEYRKACDEFKDKKINIFNKALKHSIKLYEIC